jgi:hypothetical protein
MADELPETPDAAIRAYLFAIGFTLVLIGGELMAEKEGNRFWTGVALILIGLPVHLTWVFWTRLKPKFAYTGLLPQASAIATDLRWWLGAVLIFLAAMVFSPIIQTPRWPSWPRSALGTVPTSLRLQFNALGSNPEEIEKHNIGWTIYRDTETKKTGTHTKRVCPETTITLGQFTLPPVDPSANCSDETFPDYTDFKYVTFILFFPVTIEAKDIKLNSHGAELPRWEKLSMSGNSAAIRFSGEPTRMILDVEILN